MPRQKRHKTAYPGVYYIQGIEVGSNRPERIYYIKYYRGGKRIEEKAGRQHQNDMTPAKASTMRGLRIKGKELPNRQVREEKARVRWTVDQLWEEYKKSRVNNHGLVSDQNRYNLHVKDQLGARELKDLCPLDIDRIKRRLLKTRSPQTVKHVLGIVKRLHHFAVKKGLCQGLGFMIEAPKVNNVRTEDLSPDQLSALLKAIEKSTHPVAGPMMLTALYTGMRRGEMFKLKWDDIDFDRGFILIREPKGGVSQKIPLNEAARKLFESLRRTSEFVFPGFKGKQRVTVSAGVVAIREAAGLPKDFRPLHGLRHVYASMLASSGQVDMYTLQKLLTHKSPQMTQRYAHLRDESLKRAADLAGDIIDQVAKKT
jgi:integrase